MLFRSPRHISIQAGKTAKFQLDWKSQLLHARGQIPALAPFVALIESALNKKIIPATLQAKGGKLTFNLQAQTPPLKEMSLAQINLQPTSTFSLEKLALRDRGGLWILPQISFKATPAQIHLDTLAWQVRNWKGALVPLTIDLKSTPQAVDVRIHAPEKSLILNSTLPITLSHLDGAYDRESKELGFSTAIEMTKTPWEDIRKNFCLTALKGFPAQVEFKFNPVHIFNDNIDPTGAARLSVFGGFAELSEFGVYNLTSSVPEFDFDLRIDEIRGVG